MLSRLLRPAIAPAALAFCALFAALPASRAQTVRVESENFAPPTGQSTLGSGPNVSKVVVVDSNATRSNGHSIGFFDYWDWLEYDVNVPSDGLYSITEHYASGTKLNNSLGVPIYEALSFYTSGQQIASADVLSNEATYQVYTDATLSQQVALKAGSNRFRLQIRPDDATGGYGAINMDYIDLTRVGAYPTLAAVSGTVSVNAGGTPTAVAGAYVSEGVDYTTATNVTRTDANGHFTLYLPAGSHSLTAFYNGFNRATVSAAAPGTQNFTLAFSGKYEAELLDNTNAGPTFGKGANPSFDTRRSNNGQITGLAQNRYIEYRSIYAPTAGVYDLSMYYSSNTSAAFGRLNVSANGKSTVELRFAGTGDYTVYQNSDKALVQLNQGANTIRFTNPDSSGANVDYFNVQPTTQPYGTLNVTVKDQNNVALPGVKVTVADTSAGGTVHNYSGTSDVNGLLSLPVAPSSYTVTVSKAGVSAMANATVANGAAVPVNLTLNITATLVEGESFVAAGPSPSPGDVVNVAGASGGQVLQDFIGSGDTGAGQVDFEYADYVVNAPADGLYQVSVNYAQAAPPSEVFLTFPNTSYQIHYFGLTTSTGPTDYEDFTFNFNGTFDEIPLKAGPNPFRVATGLGGLNIDYFTFTKVDALPALKTITGTIKGTDGTGAAPLGGVYVYANDPNYPNDPSSTNTIATTDAAGHYSLVVPTTGYNGDGSTDISVMANGYAPSNILHVTSASTADITLSLAAAPAVHIVFTDPNNTAPDQEVFQTVVGLGTGEVGDVLGELDYVQPGANSTIDLNVNVPRSGVYSVSALASSGWPPVDVPGTLGFAPNGGATVTGTFAKSGDYATYNTISNIASLPLNAGQNIIRVSFPDAAVNIRYFDFLRIKDLPTGSPTDINASGKTDLVDAELYLRRLNSLDPGTTTDINGDGQKNTADVITILKVAAGLH